MFHVLCLLLRSHRCNCVWMCFQRAGSVFTTAELQSCWFNSEAICDSSALLFSEFVDVWKCVFQCTIRFSYFFPLKSFTKWFVFIMTVTMTMKKYITYSKELYLLNWFQPQFFLIAWWITDNCAPNNLKKRLFFFKNLI